MLVIGTIAVTGRTVVMGHDGTTIFESDNLEAAEDFVREFEALLDDEYRTYVEMAA